MSRSKRILPPDSRPIADDKLNQSDMDYLVELQDILTAMRAELPKATDAARVASGGSPEDRLFARIDPDRTPRVVLITGRRGTGKTALLLTLLHRWERVASGARVLTNPKMDNGEGVWDDGLAAACRALPILDFDPMPPGMPLVAWLIRAFEPLVRHLNRSTDANLGRSHRSAGSEPVGEGTTLEDRWERLHENALTAWSTEKDGGQELARGKVRAWNQLRETWTDFVDALLVAMRKGRNPLLAQDGLLVLPIDDVDMQVARVPEIVRDLRNLHHPAVVFVVTGHRPLLVEALQLDVDGQRRRLAREMPRSEWAANVDAETDQMGDRLVQKVFPDGLTLHLDPFKLRDALHWQGRRILSWLGDSELLRRWENAASQPEINTAIQLTRRDLINLYSNIEVYSKTDKVPPLSIDQRSEMLIRLIGGDNVLAAIHSPDMPLNELVDGQYAQWPNIAGQTHWTVLTGIAAKWPTESENSFQQSGKEQTHPANQRARSLVLLATHTLSVPISASDSHHLGLVSTVKVDEDLDFENTKLAWPDPDAPSDMRQLYQEIGEFETLVKPVSPAFLARSHSCAHLLERWILYTAWKKHTTLRPVPGTSISEMMDLLWSEVESGIREHSAIKTLLSCWLSLANPDFRLDWPTASTLVDTLLHRASPTIRKTTSTVDHFSDIEKTKLWYASIGDEITTRTAASKKPTGATNTPHQNLWNTLKTSLSTPPTHWYFTYYDPTVTFCTSIQPSGGRSLQPIVENPDYLLYYLLYSGSQPASQDRVTAAVSQVGDYILVGGRLSELALLTTNRQEASESGRPSISPLLWITETWNWLTGGTPASAWMTVHPSNQRLAWSGPRFTLHAITDQRKAGITQSLGWRMETDDAEAQRWLDEDLTRHLAAAGWLGLATSVDQFLAGNPNDTTALRHHITIGTTGIGADLVGTDSRIPLRWIEIERLWLALNLNYMDRTAIKPLRANQSIFAMRLVIQAFFNLHTPIRKSNPPNFDNLEENAKHLLRSLIELNGVAPPEPVKQWLIEAMGGLLDQYRDEIPAEIIAALETYTMPPANNPA